MTSEKLKLAPWIVEQFKESEKRFYELPKWLRDIGWKNMKSDEEKETRR